MSWVSCGNVKVKKKPREKEAGNRAGKAHIGDAVEHGTRHIGGLHALRHLGHVHVERVPLTNSKKEEKREKIPSPEHKRGTRMQK